MANIFHLLGELALAALAMDSIEPDVDVEPVEDDENISLDAGIPTG